MSWLAVDEVAAEAADVDGPLALLLLLLRPKPGWALLVNLDDLFLDWSNLTTKSQKSDDWAVLLLALAACIGLGANG